MNPATSGLSGHWQGDACAAFILHIIEEPACLDEIGEAEALGEGGVDRGEQVVRLGNAALVTPEPGEVAFGAEFEQAGYLRAGNLQGMQELAFHAGSAGVQPQ